MEPRVRHNLSIPELLIDANELTEIGLFFADSPAATIGGTSVGSV